MNYTNAEVVLSVDIAGAQATRGSYEFSKTNVNYFTTDNGTKEKVPVGTVKTLVAPVYHECSFGVKLNSQFVNWAISEESRPKKKVSAGYWKNLTRPARLKYHIAKYVDDMFGSANFSYQLAIE